MTSIHALEAVSFFKKCKMGHLLVINADKRGPYKRTAINGVSLGFFIPTSGVMMGPYL